MPATSLLDTFYFRIHSDVKEKMFDITITDNTKKHLLTYQHVDDSFTKRDPDFDFILNKIKQNEYFMATFINSIHTFEQIAFWITVYSNEYIIYLKDTRNGQYICKTIRIKMNRRNKKKLIKMVSMIQRVFCNPYKNALVVDLSEVLRTPL